jgi:NADPH2:quinone reductase
MKALMCREFGSVEKLALEEVADPVPGQGEVVVRVVAAALNFPDTLTITGRYQIRPELPFIPGGECAGTVETLGAGVTGVQTGNRVIVIGTAGAFAERRLARADELVTIPDGMPLETAAGFLAAYGTAYYALKQRGRLKPGEYLVVLGAAGGLGRAAVDLGTAMGATVIAAASTEDKLDRAVEAGATHRINYRKAPLKDEIKRLTGGAGADLVFDPVGGEYSEQALRATGWNGRFLVIGFAAGEIPQIPLNLVLLKNNAIAGVFYGAWAQREPEACRQNSAELFELFTAGRLHPLVSARYPLERYADAFAALMERRAVGKVLLVM